MWEGGNGDRRDSKSTAAVRCLTPDLNMTEELCSHVGDNNDDYDALENADVVAAPEHQAKRDARIELLGAWFRSSECWLGFPMVVLPQWQVFAWHSRFCTGIQRMCSIASLSA